MSLYHVASERSIARPLGLDLAVICLQYDEQTLWMLGYPDQSSRRGEEAGGEELGAARGD